MTPKQHRFLEAANPLPKVPQMMGDPQKRARVIAALLGAKASDRLKGFA